MSTKKQIPELASQIVADLGFGDDDASATLVRGHLERFHRAAETEVGDRFKRPHETGCPGAHEEHRAVCSPT